ncbi:hypothetical protein [Rhizobium sp. IBUN]|uniref:hypothetical protein n=1 Tax=Rhizobium sp. IBUN TaxID=1042326 RepID=UPI00046FB20C|nr:hypothetical protein [Rhizobium sp. IBUN]
MASVELNEAQREMLLRSLTEVGSSKPVGYLPLYTIEKILRSTPETLAAIAVTRGLATAQFAEAACCIKSGAFYAYHREALDNLLQENADAVRIAGLPHDPDDFVAHIAAIWYAENHAAHPIIVAAFGEKDY